MCCSCGSKQASKLQTDPNAAACTAALTELEAQQPLTCLHHISATTYAALPAMQPACQRAQSHCHVLRVNVKRAHVSNHVQTHTYYRARALFSHKASRHARAAWLHINMRPHAAACSEHRPALIAMTATTSASWQAARHRPRVRPLASHMLCVGYCIPDCLRARGMWSPEDSCSPEP